MGSNVVVVPDMIADNTDECIEVLVLVTSVDDGWREELSVELAILLIIVVAISASDGNALTSMDVVSDFDIDDNVEYSLATDVSLIFVIEILFTVVDSSDCVDEIGDAVANVLVTVIVELKVFNVVSSVDINGVELIRFSIVDEIVLDKDSVDVE